ncbi:MAG: flotillin family protein [Anaerolinea sp.]|nr:flotillin family protein [Anaerolinea sp.]
MDYVILIPLVVMLASMFLPLAVYARRVHTVGPNEVLVISGRTEAPRFVTGGRTFVWPILERVDSLSLELIAVPLQLRHVKTQDGGTTSITATANVKIGSDEMAIRTASIQLLSKQPDEIRQITQEILNGNFRLILGMTATKIIRSDWEALTMKVWEVSNEPLAAMGLEIVSLVIQDVETGGKSSF